MDSTTGTRESQMSTAPTDRQESSSPESAQVTEQTMQDAINQAQKACQTTGDYSTECVTAWDVVETMQAENPHSPKKESTQASFDRYCAEHPDADQCRIYDV
ncbi:Calvin cycle protein CP12 [Leptolyngbya sp. FACHB-36]|uniref:Calvin cycle protein CP12 n=1 Tax=Leptolyngbya sp. FACHB-36 TaxID=2692808 RepID=UPI001680D1E8|nr:Calvin cycle protein CP12 [Leptolyngbya sp. FACHB-36]MBD2021037.1 Calvin cycle protein CP12 [Leptolyngbya sp. FACHB-36]